MARQPAKRSACIDVIEQRLAAVSFEFNTARCLSRLLPNRMSERGDEYLDRLRPVRSVCFAQYGAGQIGVECLLENQCVGICRRCFRVIDRQVIVSR